MELQSASTFPRQWSGRIAIVILTGLTAIYACIRMFTGFSFYDDEGALLLMSRWIGDGHIVYREFGSIYGPFYFLYSWLGQILAGGAPSHAASRLLAVGPWVLTCMVAFAYTLRLTASRAAALAAWLAMLRTLTFLSFQPGHPHQISVLLLITLLVVASRPRTGYLAISGALVAALMLTKVNLGAFAGASLILACASACPAGRIRTFLITGTGAACVAAPCLLMLPVLGKVGVLESCTLFTLSILAVVLVLAAKRPDVVISTRQVLGLALGFALCTTLVLSWTVLRGASLAGIAQSTVWNNLSLAHTWTIVLRTGSYGVLTGTAGVIFAILWLAGVRSSWFEWLRLSVGALALVLLTVGEPLGAFAVALPFAWMVMVPGAATTRLWPRRVLAAVAVMEVLIIYPIAGNQMRFALVPLALTSTLMFHDAWVAVLPIIRRRWTPQPYGRVAIALLLATYCLAAGLALSRYVASTPLDFSGTSFIRIDPIDRDTYYWAVSHARSDCDSLVSFPVMHSLYFWTGMFPPVYPDVDGWQPYSNQDRQNVERRILSSPRACVLIIDSLIPLWFPSKGAAEPALLVYIHENFAETDQRHGFHFLVRKPPLSQARTLNITGRDPAVP